MSQPKVFENPHFTSQVLNLAYAGDMTAAEIQALNAATERMEALHDHPAAIRLDDEESLHVRAIRVGPNEEGADPETKLLQLTWLDTGCSEGASIVMTPEQAERLTTRLFGALQAFARGHEDASIHTEIEP